MGEFAGWQMPISYAGTVAEHTAVRERVGVFDVSHLGKLMVRGDDARERLDAQLTSRIANLAPWRARYTLICNDDAGILDDLIVYCLAPDECLLVPNAANRDLVAARLAAETLEWATIAVQGPRSPELVAEWFPFAKDLG